MITFKATYRIEYSVTVIFSFNERQFDQFTKHSRSPEDIQKEKGRCCMSSVINTTINSIKMENFKTNGYS